MTRKTPGEADRILDGLDDAAFGALLDAVEAPSDGFEGISLSDLAGGREHIVGEAGRVPDLARDLLGDGDGATLAGQLRAGDGAAWLALAIEGQALILLPGEEARVAGLSLGSRVNLLQLRHIRALLQDPDEDSLPATVKWLWRIDAGNGATLEARAGDDSAATRRSLDAALEQPDLGALLADLAQGRAHAGQARQRVHAALLDAPDRILEVRRLPFLPRLAVGLNSASDRSDQRPWHTARLLCEDVLRQVIGQVLEAGLQTKMEPFPQTEVEFDRIVGELRHLPSDNLDQRLVLGGFANHPVDGDYGTMRCRECIYYLPHRRWCDLPELPLPVEPDWYCRLWKM